MMEFLSKGSLQSFLRSNADAIAVDKLLHMYSGNLCEISLIFQDGGCGGWIEIFRSE